MKGIASGLVGLFLLVNLSHAADKVELKDENANISYSVGYQIGGDFRRQGLTLNEQALVQGILDAGSQNEPLLSTEAMQATLAGLKQKIVAGQMQAARQESSRFLAENAKRPGVVVLPGGVQYKELAPGSGPHPTLADSVTIKNRMHRLKGTELVADQRTSDPKTYALNQVLPGLQEVLQRMAAGATWQVVLPPGPAMAAKGETLENAGVLVYELELISIQPGK